MTSARLEDGPRSSSIVERSDGVRYRVYDGTATSALPHDLGHLIVERETDDHGGFWSMIVDPATGAEALSRGEELVLEWPDRRTRPPAPQRGTAADRGRRDHGRRAGRRRPR